MNDIINLGLACRDEETIIAQCTPQGAGAICLLRMSGNDAIHIATEIGTLASGKKLSAQKSHTIHFGWIHDARGKKIDQVMFILMHAPKTFTGQNTVEITTHNNPFIASTIIKRAIQAGARLAQEGEFSKRAFLNKKIDLAQAEAINELIHAQTELSLKSSLAQLEGSLSHEIKTIEQDLLTALALSEASFEFIEDEETEFGQQITEIIKTTKTTIEKIKKNFGQNKQIRQGVRIALIGSVNAGKSSLFNALLDQKRAIVTNIPGTTRDVIEAGLYQNGTYRTLIDTAGLRSTQNEIEKEGISRSIKEAESADIILLIYDGSRLPKASEQKMCINLFKKHAQKTIIVQNKIDLGSAPKNILSNKEPICISCKNKKNLLAVETAIEKKIQNLFADIASPFLLNQRQHDLLLSLEKKLQAIIPLLQKNPAYELVSLHLKDALEQTSEFFGKTISKQAVDKIFQTFCVGK